MKFLRYFFYLATNWNLPIALHIVRNDIRGEKKYGIDTTGADQLRDLAATGVDISHATLYMPASYDLLEKFLHEANVKSAKHFMDIGCGKGRALCVAAEAGAQKLTGIELSRKLFLYAKKNLAETKKRVPEFRYELFNNDAFWFDIPRDADCVFLFNPFDEVIMSGVIENIEVSLFKQPRSMKIIYINPVHKDLFLRMGYRETFHYREKHYLEGSILEKTSVK